MAPTKWVEQINYGRVGDLGIQPKKLNQNQGKISLPFPGENNKPKGKGNKMTEPKTINTMTRTDKRTDAIVTSFCQENGLSREEFLAKVIAIKREKEKCCDFCNKLMKDGYGVCTMAECSKCGKGHNVIICEDCIIEAMEIVEDLRARDKK